MSKELGTDIVEAVRTHVEFVLEHGRDNYGRAQTPLFVDAIDVEKGEGVHHDTRSVPGGGRLSNVAAQQPFFRALEALTRSTGDDTYRDEAAETVRWVFENCTDDAGLPYWGGHVAYDLDADEPIEGPHELKFEYPFYELLWTVDPGATERFVEAFWNAHVRDWSRLDFNRHGGWDRHVEDVWDHEYEGGDVFFWGDGLTFVNTGSDLYYAAGLLAAFTDDDAPLTWAKRLARRYVETRQEPGISGYQFSQHPSYCNGPEIRGDRAQYQFAPYIHGDHLVYEGTLFRPRPIVQRQQLALGERLGERGEAFTRWAVEELRAWREVAYRPEENEFEPMLTDGLSLDGFVCRRDGYFGPKGRVVGPIECGPDFLWTYARAARVAGDDLCWKTAREIARGLGLGDIGAPDGAGVDLVSDAPLVDYRTLYALLELHRATNEEAYLEAASRVGQALLDERRRDDGGPFVDDEGRVVLEDPVPLALLRLAATLRGDAPSDLPTPVGDRRAPAGGI